MAKFHLGLAAAFVAIFVVLAHVSTAHRTIITTVTVEESGSEGSGKCQKQIETSSARHCETLLTETAESTTEGMKHLTECCSELKKVEESCRCEMLDQIMRKGDIKSHKMQTVQETARVLPQMCGVGPKVCEFSMTKI